MKSTSNGREMDLYFITPTVWIWLLGFLVCAALYIVQEPSRSRRM